MGLKEEGITNEVRFLLRLLLDSCHSQGVAGWICCINMLVCVLDGFLAAHVTTVFAVTCITPFTLC
jgi:hypothetical protein